MPTYDLEILIRTSKAGTGLQDTEKQVTSFSDKLRSAQSVAMNATKIFGALAGGAALAWRTIGQGVELENTERRFGRLADSINITSDALLNNLQSATRGTRSEIELMTSAADLMGLGLAKNKDELVRLTRVSGALNMNMNQLVLTLTNQTTARFDQLGVSVDGFKEKVAALEKQGYDTNAAFKEAFLQQAEAQIGKVGDTADTTAGAMQRLTARARNFVDDGLLYIAKRSGPALEGLANYFDAVERAQTDMNTAVAAGIITQDEANTIVNLAARGHDQWQARLREVRAELTAQQTILKNVTDQGVSYYIGMGLIADAERVHTQTLADVNYHQEEAYEGMVNATVILEDNRAAVAASKTEYDSYRESLRLTAEEQDRLAAAMGDYFTTAVEAYGTSDDIIANTDAMNQALYDAADAAGVGADKLALLGVSAGLISPEMAAAALQAAAMQAKVEELGLAIKNGMDPQVALNHLETFRAGLEAQDFMVRVGIDTDLVSKDSGKIKDAVQPAIDDTKTGVEDLGLSFVSMQETATGQFTALSGSVITTKTSAFDPLYDTVSNLRTSLAEMPSEVRIKVIYETVGTPPPGGSTGGAVSGGGAPAGAYATGGIVPGPIGRPQVAVVHGGEEVLTPEQRKQRGGVTIENLVVNVGGYSRQSSQQIAASIAQEIGRL